MNEPSRKLNFNFAERLLGWIIIIYLISISHIKSYTNEQSITRFIYVRTVSSAWIRKMQVVISCFFCFFSTFLCYKIARKIILHIYFLFFERKLFIILISFYNGFFSDRPSVFFLIGRFDLSSFYLWRQLKLKQYGYERIAYSIAGF